MRVYVKHFEIKLVALFLAIHVGMLSWLAWVHSPLVDEPAHLASGLHHWHTFSFDLYRVNPPLVRAVASIPLLAFTPKTNWDSHTANPYRRAEFPVGGDFIAANKNHHFYLFLARLFCIPFSVLGGLVCYLWGKQLFGNVSGLLALILWCFSPMILAFGYTIMPDVAAASLGVGACYVFRKWLLQQNLFHAILAGTVLGIAELCKFTLLVLYPVFAIVWLASIYANRNQIKVQRIVSQLKQLTVIFGASIFIINMGYGFEGSFIQLKDYEFISRTLCAKTKWNHETGFTTTGNRFRDLHIGKVPIPLPYNYVSGIDVQKYDFEIGKRSYLLGQWSSQGWHSYYFIGLLFKEPLAYWILLLLAFCTFTFSKRYRVDGISEILLVLPVIVIFLLVSSQTKLNHHLRYAIPLLPFLYLGTCRIARSLQYRNRTIIAVSGISLIWLFISAASTFPHYQGYFNEITRFGSHGKYFSAAVPPPLLGSNIDWEQNTYFLKSWCEHHPECRPIFISYPSSVSLDGLGIRAESLPKELITGYYLIGVNELFSESKEYDYFKQLQPIAHIGYSIYIYHLTQEDVERLKHAAKSRE